jgi:hypothetical protein
LAQKTLGFVGVGCREVQMPAREELGEVILSSRDWRALDRAEYR